MSPGEPLARLSPLGDPEEVALGLGFSWQGRAACRGVDPEVFFPTAYDDAWRAKEICAGCPVRIDCLAFSLRNRERYGVWGGLTESERGELLRQGLAERVLARLERSRRASQAPGVKRPGRPRRRAPAPVPSLSAPAGFRVRAVRIGPHRRSERKFSRT